MDVLEEIYDHPAYTLKNTGLVQKRARVVRLVSKINQLISRHKFTKILRSYDGSFHFRECFLYFESEPQYDFDTIDGHCVCQIIYRMKAECLEELEKIHRIKRNNFFKYLRRVLCLHPTDEDVYDKDSESREGPVW